MTRQTDFATRITHINKVAAKTERKRRGKSRINLGSLLVMPLMACTFMAAGVVMYWEVMERPNLSALQLASDLTAQILAYLG